MNVIQDEIKRHNLPLPSGQEHRHWNHLWALMPALPLACGMGLPCAQGRCPGWHSTEHPAWMVRVLGGCYLLVNLDDYTRFCFVSTLQLCFNNLGETEDFYYFLQIFLHLKIVICTVVTLVTKQAWVLLEQGLFLKNSLPVSSLPHLPYIFQLLIGDGTVSKFSPFLGIDLLGEHKVLTLQA